MRADDFKFDPKITPEEFAKFSRIIGQAIFASPVQPARASSVLGFDVGVAVTAVKIDRSATYWSRSVSTDFSKSGYVAVPRLVVSKGFGSGNASVSYAKVPNSGIKTVGGAFDIPIVDGGLIRPTLAFRASYAQLSGVDVYKQKVYGGEVFLSKGIGPVTPYVAVGRMRSNATGDIRGTGVAAPVILSIQNKSDVNRFTAGARFSLLIPKFVVEVTQAEERSYAAKVSIGF